MERKQITEMLESVINERGVPRNVRESLDDAIRALSSSGGKESKKEKVSIPSKMTEKRRSRVTMRKRNAISGVISVLDEAAGDPNLATYVRTQIWGIISLLEGLK